MTLDPAPLSEALAMPDGAHWRRCVLHVNPFAYHCSNAGSQGTEGDQQSYDRALVHALVDHGVDVIAITDHWRVRESESLRVAATAAGITVFPGFEATSQEGAHLLVLFDPATDVPEMEQRIGECGVEFTSGHSRPGSFAFAELLERVATQWGGVAIAPHITGDKGLLKTLPPPARMVAWRSKHLHAVALSSNRLEQGQRDILGGRLPDYARHHPPAQLRACDVSAPQAVAHPFASSWVKLSSLTATGLDLAFRSPGTRVRVEDPQRVAHPCIRAVAWEGGFLNGVRLHLNEGLNVLIGGRGTGKSTVLESIRFALGGDAVTERGRQAHKQVVEQVLGPASKVSLLVDCTLPSPRRYRIERLVSQAPVVFDADTGELLSSRPADVLPGVVVYGQRELAEVADDKSYQARLLSRFLPEGGAATEGVSLAERLPRSREALLSVEREIEAVDQRLARLPVVAERLASFEAAGVRESLASQTVLQREERLFAESDERVGEVRDLVNALAEATVDTVFLSASVRSELGSPQAFEQLVAALTALNTDLAQAAVSARQALDRYEEQAAAIRAQWASQTEGTRAELERLLRALQPQGIDGGEYLRLRAEREQLQPLTDQRARLHAQHTALREQRRALLVEQQDRAAARVRDLDRAARAISREMQALLRVSVSQHFDAEAVVAVLQDRVGGRLDQVVRALHEHDALSSSQLVAAARDGAEAVQTLLGVTAGQAQRVAAADAQTLLLLEEVQPRVSPCIELNIGSQEQPIWRPVEALSTGQKATALLLLLLARDDMPLLVDQPEDDLDNNFVFHGVVPRVRDSKSRRQLLLSSHNANIPVLADADLIAAMDTQRDDGRVRAVLPPERCASIDDDGIRHLVEELLEGGREAFQNRRYRYGF